MGCLSPNVSLKIPHNLINKDYLKTKKDKLGHLL